MAAERPHGKGGNLLRVPAPTAWPMIAALGLALGFAGLLTSMTVSLVGIVLVVGGAIGWFREVLPEERRETIAIEAAEAVAPPEPVTVAHLQVGEMAHRARLPLEIYPYSAGIKGGIAGGVAMAVLAVLEGIIMHGSPWYTINILAATTSVKMATADMATLCAFNAPAFAQALLIHAVLSVLMGLLYGVMLPMFPSYPALFGGIVAPALWTGLIWASLNVLNPVLDARIEWRWFISCQIAFGLTAGLVTARSERIATFQSMPFALRSGIEAAGVGQREPRE